MSILRQYKLHERYFGEGSDLVIFANQTRQIYQLTWQERQVLIYDGYLKPLRNISLPAGIKEGWGLATRQEVLDGVKTPLLYISDGSHQLFVVDPRLEPWRISKIIRVRHHLFLLIDVSPIGY
jgi:glutamine cyclotransferase